MALCVQPALDLLKILILRGVRKAGREKFWKHQNSKSCKKILYYLGIVGQEPTESNV